MVAVASLSNNKFGDVEVNVVETSDGDRGSFAGAIGVLVGLLARELGSAAAVVAGLWAGIVCVNKAAEARSPEWPLFLVGGAILVALTAVCQWRGCA